MTVLTYKGYQASATLEVDRIVIHVLHVDDHLVAECTDSTKVAEVFHELIDEYLEDCKLVGKQPDKPYKGQFNVRISPDLHRSAAKAAASMEMALNEFVGRAIEAFVETRSTNAGWSVALYQSNIQVGQPVQPIRSDDDSTTTLTTSVDLVAWVDHQRH